MNIVILGLSITSSWGNGHATIFRALVRELARRGHAVTFFERDMPWYANNRDLPEPPYGRTFLYHSLEDLRCRFVRTVRDADLAIVGSYVPQGTAVGEWVCETTQGLPAFYDIDTPITLASLARRSCDYLTPELIQRYGLYLSFTGGPTLDRLEREWGSPAARPLYCCVDPEVYFPREEAEDDPDVDLGYMGTYSEDRQPPLERLMLDAARRWEAGRFMVAGPQYPADMRWPMNVERVAHLPPAAHRDFYTRQRFTLNITRAAMMRTGYAPSVRLFEAAACATPVISDRWPGVETFFTPGEEILIADDARDTLRLLTTMMDENRRAIGRRAREKVLREHTAARRAQELEHHTHTLLAGV